MAQLQNIPSRNKPNEYDQRIQKLGPEIREIFEAEKGHKLIVVDLSQLELRLGAHFTHDPTLLGVYKEDVSFEGFVFYTGDPHAETSKRMGVPRKLAKNLNFGLMYGMMAENFARYARLYKPGTRIYDVDAAEGYVIAFHQTYAGVFAYHEKLRRAWWQGQRAFETIAGRLRHFDSYDKVAAGKIYNSKIQGSAADVMKAQLWAFENFMLPLPEFSTVKPIIQVHDEYLFEVPEDHALKCAVLIKFIMEWPFFSMDVPLLASAKICDNWKQKDDDSVPEVGTFFATVLDDPTEHKKRSLKELAELAKPRTFTAANWPEYLELDKQNAVVKKSAVAMLSARQKAWARQYLPENPPVFGRQQAAKILTFEEFVKEKENASE